jgi:hypothetical protein
MSRDKIRPQLRTIRERYEEGYYGPEIEATIEALLDEVDELQEVIDNVARAESKAHTMSERGEVK